MNFDDEAPPQELLHDGEVNLQVDNINITLVTEANEQQQQQARSPSPVQPITNNDNNHHHDNDNIDSVGALENNSTTTTTITTTDPTTTVLHSPHHLHSQQHEQMHLTLPDDEIYFSLNDSSFTSTEDEAALANKATATTAAETVNAIYESDTHDDDDYVNIHSFSPQPMFHNNNDNDNHSKTSTTAATVATTTTTLPPPPVHLLSQKLQQTTVATTTATTVLPPPIPSALLSTHKQRQQQQQQQRYSIQRILNNTGLLIRFHAPSSLILFNTFHPYAKIIMESCGSGDDNHQSVVSMREDSVNQVMQTIVSPSAPPQSSLSASGGSGTGHSMMTFTHELIVGFVHDSANINMHFELVSLKPSTHQQQQELYVRTNALVCADPHVRHCPLASNDNDDDSRDEMKSDDRQMRSFLSQYHVLSYQYDHHHEQQQQQQQQPRQDIGEASVVLAISGSLYTKILSASSSSSSPSPSTMGMAGAGQDGDGWFIRSDRLVAFESTVRVSPAASTNSSSLIRPESSTSGDPCPTVVKLSGKGRVYVCI